METTPTVMKVIPKRVRPVVDIDTGVKLKKKVAAYARVSTDMDDQKNSFNAQLDEYKTRIEKNPDWEFVKLYSDEGISGTSIKKRQGFTNLINDALSGKIDLILVKSISRFARNTVDCLSTVRKLRKKNVEVWFDKENISTNDTKIDLMLTMFASFAQEESKSISENVKWGVRKRMAKGQRKMHTATTKGYLTSPDGKVVVDKTEVDIVKEVFNLYLCGYSFREIIKIMEEQGYKTGTGKDKWAVADILRMLENEKYVGDFVMQKTVVLDFLDHKAYKNDGLEEKYVLQNHHEAIIDRTSFELVKIIRKKKMDDSSISNTINPLSGLLICENCLRPMKLNYIHPGSPYQRAVLTCKSTTKMAENYVKCDSQNTLDFILVRKATADVYRHFVGFDKSMTAFVSTAYENTMNGVAKKIIELKAKNEELQEELASIIKLQIKSDEMEVYKFKFDCAKKQIDYNNDLILKLENEAYNTYKKELIKKTVNEYLNDESLLTYQLASQLIKGAIRRSDNSIRFIIGETDIKITEENLDSLLLQKPIYKSLVKDKKRELLFDVIKVGGTQHGN